MPSPPHYNPYVQHRRIPIRKSILSYTLILILVNIIFFLIIMFSLPFLGEENFITFFRNYIALTPAVFSSHPWTLLTSMFMHAPGYPFAIFSAHLLVNMLSLFFLGSFLEKIIGSKRLLGLYFIGGIAGSLLLLLLYSLSSDPRIIALSFFSSQSMKTAVDISAVGASAAIFALAGCLAVLVPRLGVVVFFVIPMRLWMAIIFLIVIMSLVPGVANSAHLGGLLVGFFYAIYLRKKYKKKVAILNKIFTPR